MAGRERKTLISALREKGLPIKGTNDELHNRFSDAILADLATRLPGTTITPNPEGFPLSDRGVSHECVTRQLRTDGRPDTIITRFFPVTFGEKLGQGAQGIIFACKYGEMDAVCKVLPVVAERSGGALEFMFLSRLYGRGVNVPQPYSHYSSVEYDVIIMERLAHTLKEIADSRGGQMGQEEIIAMMQHLLVNLERLHSNRDVYVDIKPENIMTDYEGNACYFIDVGGMMMEGKPFGGGPQPKNVGTPRYESIDAHLGNQLGPSSDLQALGYMASSLYLGVLPWDNVQLPQNANSNMMLEAIMDEKRKTTSEQLAHGFPALKQYLDYVLPLRPNRSPDYRFMMRLFGME